MPQSLRVAWMGLAAMAGTLLCSAPRLSAAQAPEASSSSPAAATPAAAPATTPDLPFTHGKLADGATKSAVCSACHGPVGRGNLAAGYPALRAQQSVYVVKQLNDYASGARYVGPNPLQASRNGTMMFTLAKRLTPEQIRDVASYVQGMR